MSEIEKEKYDYAKEIEHYRNEAKIYRAKADDVKIISSREISILEDQAKRAEIIADYIQRICTRK